jgi:hypothetical protein
MRFFILLTIIALGCGKTDPGMTKLLVTRDGTLYEMPDLKSKPLSSVKSGDKLPWSGRVGSLESSIVFEDTLMVEPWLEIKTRDARSGWVFAGIVRPADFDFDVWKFETRVKAILGERLAARRNILIDSLNAAATDRQMAAAFTNLNRFRDTVQRVFADAPGLSDPARAPYYNWISRVLPHYICQSVGAPPLPYWFADYAEFQKKAAQTTGNQDDVFFGVCAQAFPSDKIESLFPAWTFQTGEQEGASQLGLGKHLEILKAIDAALPAAPLFKTALENLKNTLFDDITGKNVRYWQPKERILEELRAISAANLRCLNKEDRIALEARSAMFENPLANNIKVDLRSGK